MTNSNKQIIIQFLLFLVNTNTMKTKVRNFINQLNTNEDIKYT